MDTIHVLILQILDEIQFNNFKSNEYKKYLKSMLGKLQKEDFIAKEIFQEKLIDLIERINNNEINYIIRICRDMKKKLTMVITTKMCVKL